METFFTPPTSPCMSRTNSEGGDMEIDFLPTDEIIRSSLSRRGSKPSVTSLPCLQTNIIWDHDVVVERQSPTNLVRNKVVLNGPIATSSPTADTITHQLADSTTPVYVSSSPSSFNSIPLPMDSSHRPNKSPCFVHSHLDKGASLQDWLHPKDNNVLDVDVGVARSLQQSQRLRPRGSPSTSTPIEFPGRDGAHVLSANDEDEDDEDPLSGSLTRQLAETAVGVREMSKQLGRPSSARHCASGSSCTGRARIRANIQSVLIVTKARDNRLIKLTRELALYLMLKPRHGRRGLIV